MIFIYFIFIFLLTYQVLQKSPSFISLWWSRWILCRVSNQRLSEMCVMCSFVFSGLNQRCRPPPHRSSAVMMKTVMRRMMKSCRGAACVIETPPSAATRVSVICTAPAASGAFRVTLCVLLLFTEISSTSSITVMNDSLN